MPSHANGELNVCVFNPTTGEKLAWLNTVVNVSVANVDVNAVAAVFAILMVKLDNEPAALFAVKLKLVNVPAVNPNAVNSFALINICVLI